MLVILSWRGELLYMGGTKNNNFVMEQENKPDCDNLRKWANFRIRIELLNFVFL